MCFKIDGSVQLVQEFIAIQTKYFGCVMLYFINIFSNGTDFLIAFSGICTEKVQHFMFCSFLMDKQMKNYKLHFCR